MLKGDKYMKNAKWENWLILAIGIWLFSIPWTVSWGFGSNDINVVMWNFVMIGSCVITTSIISLRKLKVWPEWLALFMGVWLTFSPLFLIYWNNTFLLVNSIIFGVLITGLSALSIPIAEKRRVYLKLMRQNKTIKH